MTIALFIVVLLVLIVGHEFGHFIVAKLSGMRVDEFGVGFPPKIFGKRMGETEYTINWLPFGGFVKIFGEDKEAAAGESRAFAHRPALLQALVLFAGPFANIVMALVLSSVAFMVGTPAVLTAPSVDGEVRDAKVLVGAVLPGSPAETNGIRAGDNVVSITTEDGVFGISTPEEMSERIAHDISGAITITLLRAGEQKQIPVQAVPGFIAEEPERLAIGIATALVGTVSYPLNIAVWKGIQNTMRSIVFITVSLFTLIESALTLSADVSNLAGPIGIASLTGEAAAFGLGSLLSFAALLSVNLAIINILPFPALDGGRLLFLGIESAIKKKIPPAVAQAANAGGFFLLILLMIAVTIGDISRLFS